MSSVMERPPGKRDNLGDVGAFADGEHRDHTNRHEHVDHRLAAHTRAHRVDALVQPRDQRRRVGLTVERIAQVGKRPQDAGNAVRIDQEHRNVQALKRLERVLVVRVGCAEDQVRMQRDDGFERRDR